MTPLDHIALTRNDIQYTEVEEYTPIEILDEIENSFFGVAILNGIILGLLIIFYVL